MSETGFLRPSQRQALEQDYAVADAALNDPTVAPYIEDKARARKQAADLKKVLEEQAPQKYATAKEKDEAAARAMELREQWSTNMPSREEMRRNRDALHATSAMNVLRWEKENKSKILEWKKIVARLEPDSDDPDLCNIERYRPSRPFVYDSTAQIAGHHAMSQKAKDNWPEEMSEPKAKTAVAHLQKGK